MSFVPPVIVPQSPEPSPRARELSRRISETIDGFLRENPGTPVADVQQALNLARPVGYTSKMIVIALLVGVAVFAVLVTIFLKS